MASWQIGEAQTHLEEVLDAAKATGPQFIIGPDNDQAVVLSMEEYRALTSHSLDFKQHLLNFPKVDDFEIERDR